MADIELRLDGDSSGAEAALKGTGGATRDLADETGKATIKWQMMADVVTKSAAAYVKWGVDAVKMYAEAQRAQLQLNRAAGEYGEILGAQAEALSKVYAVDDDLIKQSYTLLTQWGGAGAATEENTKAILNYASATGKDAVTATQELIRNVESGGVGMAKMGIHFEATGKRGKDLTAAVAAINTKLNGAADGDARSLVGSAHAANLAFEDLQKSIGGMLGTALDKSGALGFITTKLREITIGAETLAAVLVKLPGFLGGVVRGNIDASTALDEIRNTAVEAFMRPDATGSVLPKVKDDPTNKGLKDGASGPSAEDRAKAEEDRRDAWRKGLKEDEEFADLNFQKDQARAAAEFALDTQSVKDTIKMRGDETAALQLSIAKDLEAEEKRAKEMAKLEAKALKDSDERTAKEAHKARAAGDAIGAAFVNALADQLTKLAAGEEFDAAIFVGDILASVISVAATVIGTAYGMPALGAAVGNLASMGVRAGAGAISTNNRKLKTSSSPYQKMHDGAWVGDDVPRHHSGAWIGADERPAILQTEERVASRQEVKNAGGRAALDSVLKGGRGPGVSVSIMAIDAKNAAESFMSDLGQGLKHALRTGHGDVPRLLGMSPR